MIPNLGTDSYSLCISVLSQAIMCRVPAKSSLGYVLVIQVQKKKKKENQSAGSPGTQGPRDKAAHWTSRNSEALSTSSVQPLKPEY